MRLGAIKEHHAFGGTNGHAATLRLLKEAKQFQHAAASDPLLQVQATPVSNKRRKQTIVESDDSDEE